MYGKADAETSVKAIEDAFKEFTNRDDIAIIMINQYVGNLLRSAALPMCPCPTRCIDEICQHASLQQVCKEQLLGLQIANMIRHLLKNYVKVWQDCIELSVFKHCLQHF